MTLMQRTFLIFIITFLISCTAEQTSETEETLAVDPQEWVDKAIEAHGSEALEKATIAFTFRDKHFKAVRDGHKFTYHRMYQDSLGNSIEEVLDNLGVRKLVNQEEVVLEEDEDQRLRTVLNSVVYFALLPYFLNDTAVQKRYLKEETIENEPYHLIEITFKQQSGGADWQDRYVYWIHKNTHTIDYLSYYFHVNGGGARFRKAVNVRTIQGIRFADYLNYASETLPPERLEEFPKLLDLSQVELLSEINTESIQVQLN